MRRLLAFITFLLVTTAALAADNPLTCVGASCKVILVPRNSGGTGVTALQVDANSALTTGATSSTNGSLTQIFNLPSAAGSTVPASTTQTFIKFLSGTSSGSFPVIAINAAGDATSSATEIISLTRDDNASGDLTFRAVNNASGNFGTSYTTTTSKAFSFSVNNGGTNEIASATRAGAWTMGISGQPVTANGGVKLPTSGGTAGTLDYYEDSISYTPQFRASGTAITQGNLTYSVQVGRAFKIGHLAWFSANMTVTAISAGTPTGSLQLNLPYTSANINANLLPPIACYGNKIAAPSTSDSALSCRVESNASLCTIQFAKLVSQLSDVDDADAGQMITGNTGASSVSKIIHCAGTYLTN